MIQKLKYLLEYIFLRDFRVRFNRPKRKRFSCTISDGIVNKDSVRWYDDTQSR